MSNPRIPANFNCDFKKNIKMTDEDHLDMINSDPELSAVIQTDQRDNVVQSQNADADQDDNLEDFNYIPQINTPVHINVNDYVNAKEFDVNKELGNDRESENGEDNHDLL